MSIPISRTGPTIPLQPTVNTSQPTPSDTQVEDSANAAPHQANPAAFQKKVTGALPAAEETLQSVQQGRVQPKHVPRALEHVEAYLGLSSAQAQRQTAVQVVLLEGLSSEAVLEPLETGLSPTEQKHLRAFGQALKSQGVSPEQLGQMRDLIVQSPELLESLSTRALDRALKKEGLSDTQKQGLSGLRQLMSKIERQGSWTALNALQGVLHLAEASLPEAQQAEFAEQRTETIGQTANLRRAASIRYGESLRAQANGYAREAAALRKQGNDPDKAAHLEKKAERYRQGALRRLESEKKDAHRFVRLRQDKGLEAPRHLLQQSTNAAMGAADVQLDQQDLGSARENLDFARELDPELRVSPEHSHAPEVVQRNLRHAGQMRRLESIPLEQMSYGSVAEHQHQLNQVDLRYDQEIAWAQHLPQNTANSSRMLTLMRQQDDVREEMAQNLRGLQQALGQLESQTSDVSRAGHRMYPELSQTRKAIGDLEKAVEAAQQELREDRKLVQGMGIVGLGVSQEHFAEQEQQIAALEARLQSAQEALEQGEVHLEELESGKVELRKQSTELRKAQNELTGTRAAAYDALQTEKGRVLQGSSSLSAEKLVKLRDTRHAEMQHLASELLSDAETAPTQRANAIGALSDGARYQASVAMDDPGFRRDLSRSEAARHLFEQARAAYEQQALPPALADSTAADLADTALTVSDAEIRVDANRAVESLHAARELTAEITTEGPRQQLEAKVYGKATEHQRRLMAPDGMKALYRLEQGEMHFSPEPLMELESMRREMGETAEQPELRQQIQDDLALEAEARLNFKLELENKAQGLLQGARWVMDNKDEFLEQYIDRVDEAVSDLIFWEDDAENADIFVEDLRQAAGQQFVFAQGLRQMAVSMGSDSEIADNPKSFFLLQNRMNFEHAIHDYGGSDDHFLGQLMSPDEYAEFHDQPRALRDKSKSAWERSAVAPSREFLMDHPYSWSFDATGPMAMLADVEAAASVNDLLDGNEDILAGYTLLKLADDKGSGLSALAAAGYPELQAMELSDPEEMLVTDRARAEVEEEAGEFQQFVKDTELSVALTDFGHDLLTSVIPGGALTYAGKGLGKLGALMARVPGLKTMGSAADKIGDGFQLAKGVAERFNAKTLLERALLKSDMGSKLATAGGGLFKNIGAAGLGELNAWALGELSPELAQAFGAVQNVFSFGTNTFKMYDAATSLGEAGLNSFGQLAIEDQGLFTLAKILNSASMNTLADRFSGATADLTERAKAAAHEREVDQLFREQDDMLREMNAPGTSPERKAELLTLFEQKLELTRYLLHSVNALDVKHEGTEILQNVPGRKH